MTTQTAIRAALFLLFAIACAQGFTAAENEAAARVVIAVGTVEAIAADGTVRSLERGDPIYEGDTIRSGTRARAQIRFTDGARMSIRPESEISVDDYEFEEAAPPQGVRSALSLRRGGFRTATGRVADLNRSAYRVSTPFAIVGVRGTDWSAAIADVGQGDNLFLGVDDGGITASNDAGSLDIGDANPFSFARIRSFDALPEGLDSLPTNVAASFRATPLPPAGDDDGAGGDDASPPAAGGGDEEEPGGLADSADGEEVGSSSADGAEGTGSGDQSGDQVAAGDAGAGTSSGDGAPAGGDPEVLLIPGSLAGAPGNEADSLPPVFELGLGCF